MTTSNASNTAEETTIGSVGEILRRRRGALVLAAVLGVALGVGLNLVLPSVYRGRVRIEIRRPPGSPGTGVVSFQSEQVAMYTAAERISSRALLGRVAAELRSRGPAGADALREGGAPARSGWMASARAAVRPFERWLAPARGPLGSDAGPAAEIDRLQEMVSVRPVRDTRLVDVFVDHTDPESARRIAGRIAALFEESVARDEGVPDSAAALHAAPVGDAGTPTPFAPDRAAVQARIRELNARLADLTGSRVRTHTERIDAARQLELLRRRFPESQADWSRLPADGPLGASRRDLLACEQRLEQARETYGPQHPRLLEIQSEREGLRSRAQRDYRQAIVDQRAQVSALAAREEMLGSEAREAEAELRRAIALDRSGPAVPELMVPGTEATLRSPAVSIVDGPSVDPRPIRPRRALNVVACGAAGLLFGSALVLLRSGSGRYLLTPDEVEAELELPVLGVLPKLARAGAMEVAR